MSSNPGNPAEQAPPGAVRMSGALWLRILPLAALFAALYWIPFEEMISIWSLGDSYYSHGFLVVPVFLFLVWRQRKELAQLPRSTSLWGYPLMLLASAMIILGAFLGFAVFGHLSVIPMAAGLILVLLGSAWMSPPRFSRRFPLFYDPHSSLADPKCRPGPQALRHELRGSAGRLLTLPMVHDGSFVHFGNDFLLIGDVCGGLRSLIAMLALGALMAYFGRCRLWARFAIFVIAGPIAIASNVFRILLLCIVGYMWGSPAATGVVHDRPPAF